MKRVLAVIASHYEINHEWVCEGYILLKEDDLAVARGPSILSCLAIRWQGGLVVELYATAIWPQKVDPFVVALNGVNGVQ